MTALALLLTLHTAATPGKHLTTAETACYQMKYAACLEALQRARVEPGNSRATLLRILELEGLTAAQLKQVARAQDALRRLFVLEGEHRFAGSYAPRVNTQILEARGWARAAGALRVSTHEPNAQPGRVTALIIELDNDPLGLVRVLRVHHRARGETKVTELSATRGRQEVPVDEPGAAVEWWVEAVGEYEAVLLELGTPAEPLVARAPEPPRPVLPEARAPAEPPATAALSTVTQATSPDSAPSLPRFRAAAWTTSLTGVALVGVGAYFAFATAAARAQLERPVLDGSGVVVELTQSQAQALEATMQRDAWLANVLLAAGGALVVTGFTLFVVGSPSGATVGVQVKTD
jgi:hypothetical protein